MKTLLITGGAGFMGSNFIRFILNKYPNAYKIINIDKLTYCGNLNNLKNIEKHPNYTFIKGDIADENLVNQVTKNVNAIINYAAETHVDRSILDPKSFIKTDILGTHNLLEAVRKSNIEKFIQISTDEVYGQIFKGSFSEQSPFNPRNPYSASKAGADLLIQSYNTTYSLPTIITHSCNFYGPYQYPEKIIPLFITNLLQGEKVPIYGDGKQIREWIFTEDHCKAIDLLIQKGKIGETYNIGTGNEIENIELTKLILQTLNKTEKEIAFIKDRPGHDFRYSLDWSKIKSLGWKPEINFADGLKKTIKWYIENEWWWKSLKSGEYLNYYKRQYQEVSHE